MHINTTMYLRSTPNLTFLQVIEINQEDESYSVRFMRKSGSNYVQGPDTDVGLVKAGVPDYFEWIVLSNDEYELAHRGHFVFKI